MSIGVYWRTLRHLRVGQLQHQLLTRLARYRRAAVPAPATARRSGFSRMHWPATAEALVDSRMQFTFLNATYATADGRVDWAPARMSRLWRYNLHYFDYLLQDDLEPQRAAALLDDWIRNNAAGRADAWDAYPVSLRIVNWVKYFLRPGVEPQQIWLESLAAQAAWLARHFEYHLLANHLLKNTVALLYAGAYLAGPTADEWLRRGWREFLQQVDEQFLPDGGHFERSPMYHAICLADCLDVLMLARQPALAGLLPGAERLTQVTQRSLAFLSDLTAPDGDIALFNDSAFGIAPPYAALLSRMQKELAPALMDAAVHTAGALAPQRAMPVQTWHPSAPEPKVCDGSHTPRNSRLELIDRPHSGYFGVRDRNDLLLIDCGAVGPDYQPGHAHCDTLSFELSLDGRRVVVDSGVHDYEWGERRRLARSTAAHNTVMIDGQEQSEVWGAFRVGRRARPLSPSIRRQGMGVVFEGAHDGYRHLPGKPVHNRRVHCDAQFVVEVYDEIEGVGVHTVESRIRLHPDCRVVLERERGLVFGRDGRGLARVDCLAGGVPRIETGRYFPRFGVEYACTVLVLQASGALPLRLAYRISKGQ